MVASKQTKVPSVKRKKRLTVPMTTSRSFFDGEDHCYIIDANKEGNVACFLNVRPAFITHILVILLHTTTTYMHYLSIVLQSFELISD